MFSPIVRFLLSHGASAFSTGVHLVVLAWIAVAELGLSASLWGWVQAGALLPNLLLILVAGAWADRVDPARVLSMAQGLLSLSYAGLLVLVFAGQANFAWLLCYAVFVGTGHAFIQPVREKLITDIEKRHKNQKDQDEGEEKVGGAAQKRLSLLSITQFSLQSCGIGLAALTETFGLAAIISIQALVSLFSCAVFASLMNTERSYAVNALDTFAEIAGTIRHVWQHSALKQLMALAAFNGYMHMGVFLVVIPVLANRTYDYSSSEYAGLQLLFVFGMIFAHVPLLRGKLVEFPGQGALFSLLYTALIGFGLSKGPTPFGFYSLVFLWGLVAGNSAGRCRLVLQSLVQPEMKGKVMALYQLMLFGAAPIGALVTGYVMNYMAISAIFTFMSISSVVLFGLFMMSRTLWAITQVK